MAIEKFLTFHYLVDSYRNTISEWAGFQVWKFHLKISPWEKKACRGLIFGGEEISIPETRPIRKSYISYLTFTCTSKNGPSF
jgi:hypothetical protein